MVTPESDVETARAVTPVPWLPIVPIVLTVINCFDGTFSWLFSRLFSWLFSWVGGWWRDEMPAIRTRAPPARLLLPAALPIRPFGSRGDDFCCTSCWGAEWPSCVAVWVSTELHLTQRQSEGGIFRSGWACYWLEANCLCFNKQLYARSQASIPGRI